MALSASETDQLKATLVIRNKPFLVKLTSSEICWEQISSPSATGGRASFTQLSSSSAATSSTSCKTKKDAKKRAVKCNEVISVKLGCGSDSPIKGKFHHLEAITIDSTFFSIWFIERYQQHRWRPQHVSFQSRDSTVAQQWVDRMQAILSAPELKRPRSLLLFINPICGRKKGPSIFQKTARPLFELAGVSCDVVMTERHNHAKDVLLDYDLTKIDGVVCVGGDGMLSELMHGLLTLSVQEQGLSQPRPNDPLPQPSLRIGVIPAGSTNAVVCSTNGTEDPMTATLHIILGDSVAMDVGTVHHGDKFLKYNISLLGYGYYGDCMMESEETRWMGPRRYNWFATHAKKMNPVLNVACRVITGCLKPTRVDDLYLLWYCSTMVQKGILLTNREKQAGKLPLPPPIST
ncbi:Ceramide kinase [Lamellibrachia satsuma]|nr:Ceramide kinase [Lamellibrachia satsuma]